MRSRMLRLGRGSLFLRTYVANQKTQDPSECWPFRVRYEYSDIISQSCRVHLSNRRLPENVEAHLSNRRLPENVEAPEPIPIVISSRSETNSGDDAAYEAEQKRKGGAVAHEIPSGAEIEYERQLNVAILESLESFYNSGLARGLVGNIGNDSDSNSVTELANVSHCPNEDSVDEGAQTEALDAVRGTIINCSIDSDHTGRTIRDTEPTDSMPRPGVSCRGCLLNPTHKLLQLANATDDPAGKGTCGSKQEQSKKRCLNTTIALERSSGSGSVVGQDSRANGVARQADVVNLDGSGVGGSGPTEPTYAWGQASGANAVGHQMDMIVPFLEHMVCVTNLNPMDLTIEEAKKYMRTE